MVVAASNPNANPNAPGASLNPPQFAANVRAADAAFPPDEFHTVQNVPVFAEHETTSRDGRRLRFGPPELQAVANRCNQRIRDTGDYAAVVIGHTSAPDDPHQKEPEVVGFAGPFKLGTLGQSGGKQRAAILADFHFFKADLEKAKKYPRRSPELWLEDRYEEMFLDPIALLGAEAPRLDMGLLYSAMYHGRLRERYTAVAPSAGNVAIRDDDIQPEHYQEGSPMLGPDDIRQIVEALESLDWVQGVKELLAANEGNNASFGDEPAPPLDPAIPGPAGPEMGQPAPAAGPADGLPADLPGPMPSQPAPGNPDGPLSGADSAPMAPPTSPDPGPAPAPASPPPAPSAPAGNPAGPPEAPDADVEKEKLSRYAAMDELEDEEFEEYARSRRDRKRRKYAAGEDDDEPEELDELDVDPKPDDAPADPPAKPKEAYRRSGEVLALRRELDQVKQRLDGERAARVEAERYSLLAERRQMYAFDLEDETERCRYAKMNDEQFADHLKVIEQNYKQIPLGAQLPTFTPQAQRAADTAPTRIGGGAAREHYSKETSDAAREWCERRSLAGKAYDYEVAVKTLREGKVLPE